MSGHILFPDMRIKRIIHRMFVITNQRSLAPARLIHIRIPANVINGDHIASF